jgi:hypothetical protein
MDRAEVKAAFGFIWRGLLVVAVVTVCACAIGSCIEHGDRVVDMACDVVEEGTAVAQ